MNKFKKRKKKDKNFVTLKMEMKRHEKLHSGKNKK